MLGTVVPLRKTSQGRLSSAAYAGAVVVASVLGAAVIFGALRLAHSLISPVVIPDGTSWRLLFAGTAGLLLLSPPANERSVHSFNRGLPIHWRYRFGMGKAGIAYAFILGTAVSTRMNSRLLLAVLIFAVIAPSGLWAATVMLSFGAARALAILGAIRLQDVEAYFADPEHALGRLALAKSHLLRSEASLLLSLCLLAAYAGRP